MAIYPTYFNIHYQKQGKSEVDDSPSRHLHCFRLRIGGKMQYVANTSLRTCLFCRSRILRNGGRL